MISVLNVVISICLAINTIMLNNTVPVTYTSGTSLTVQTLKKRIIISPPVSYTAIPSFFID